MLSLGQAHFWPQGYNLNKFGRGLLGDATYHVVSVKKIFSCFPYISLCKTAGPFLVQGHNLNILGCHLPNIKALRLVVSDKKIFSCFPYIILCKTCDPRAGPF